MIANGIYTNYPEDDYFADPCETPSLSQSIAKIIIYQSEKHAWLEHPRLGGKPRKATHKMDIGTICHAMMTGKPLPEIELIPFDDYKTKDARALRDLAIEQGKIPMKTGEAGEWERLKGAAEALRDGIKRRGIEFKPEECEVAFFWTKDGVQHRARLDNLQGCHAIDLKFVDSANPDAIDRSVANFGYQIQHAAYTEAIRECCIEARGRETFTLVYCEINEPYCVTPATLSAGKQRLGVSQWERARRQWSECLQTGVWNEYVPIGSCHVVEAKSWELERELGEGYGDQNV